MAAVQDVYSILFIKCIKKIPADISFEVFRNNLYQLNKKQLKLCPTGRHPAVNQPYRLIP